MNPTYEEIEAKIALLEVQLKLSEAAERAWESSMMQACGEDGPKSVADKFAELESKLETALRECRSAGITIDNLEAKCAALAAENAGMSARTPVAYSYRYAGCETCDGFQDWRWELSKEKPSEWMIETGKVTNLIELFELPETPVTDAFLDEVRAQGVEMYADNLDNAAEDAERCGFDYAVKFLRSEASSVRLFADQLRKGTSSAKIHGSDTVTDNTNQQFESLSKGDK